MKIIALYWKKILVLFGKEGFTGFLWRFRQSLLYKRWLYINAISEKKRASLKQELLTLKYQPLISILLPVYNVDEIWLRKCIDSVLGQIYQKWELCIADDASSKDHIRLVLEKYRQQDQRIKVIYRKENGHISAASNSALGIANGEFIALLDHDDQISPHALLEIVKLLNKNPDADMIYSDEDKISASGKRYSPYFKADWSPDLIMAQNYICHLLVCRRKLVLDLNGFRVGFEGSQDHDLVLRLAEKTDKIYHVRDVLYHWRSLKGSTAEKPDAKEYAYKAGVRAIEETLTRRNEIGRVEQVSGLGGQYRVNYLPGSEPFVSIIITVQGNLSETNKCVQSLLNNPGFENFEIIIIDKYNRKIDDFKLNGAWGNRHNDNIVLVHSNETDNKSYTINQGVALAKGNLVLFLNDRTEVITGNWLSDMTGYALRVSTGAVGAVICTKNTILHAGLVLGVNGLAGFSHRGFSNKASGYYSKLLVASNYAVLSGDCLMVKKALFNRFGGFDEELPLAYYDLDFCLKLYEKGFYNVLIPSVRFLYQGLKNRAMIGYKCGQDSLLKEEAIIRKRWGELIEDDPFYNPHLTRLKEDYSIKIR